MSSNACAKKGKDDISDDSFECGLCSWGQTTKICISCEQKLEQAENDDNDISQNDTEDFNSVTIQKNASICANCGKEGTNVTNTCNKCKEVSIAMPHVRRNIDINIRRHVKGE